jgi:IS5 family transposase
VLRTVSDAPTLWESVIPECLMGLPGDLGEIDELLDDPRSSSRSGVSSIR